jgi:FkbM family methyltransferase
VEHPVQNGAKMTRGRVRGTLYVTATLLVLLAASPAVIGWLRPPEGYVKATAGLMNPALAGRLQTLEDIQTRKTDFEVEYFGYRYRGNTGNLVDAYTYYFGAYEKPQLFFMRDTLTATGPQAVTLDVGANLGLYTLVAARYSGLVHAFEPYPPVLERLRHNLESNQVPNVTVHPVGLGATKAALPFAPPPDDNLGLGSFEHATGGTADQRLKVVAGDVYLREAGVTRVDFIKMDIEGFEKPALAGLRQTLQRDRPIVLLEVSTNPGESGLFASADDLRAAFPEGYAFFDFVPLDMGAGTYALRPLSMPFGREGHAMVVARPANTQPR